MFIAQAPFRRVPMRIQAARVGGVEIPNAKRIEFSLQYVFGVGHTTAKAILADTVRTAASVSSSPWLFASRASRRAIKPMHASFIPSDTVTHSHWNLSAYWSQATEHKQSSQHRRGPTCSSSSSIEKQCNQTWAL